MPWQVGCLFALVLSALSIPCADTAWTRSQTPVSEVDEKVLESRLKSYLDGGYDPLTVPTDWYGSIEQVKGAADPSVELVPPMERSIANSALKAAASYAESEGSVAMIVARHGEIEYERYWRDNGRDSLFNPQSMSKTLVGLLVGIAIQDGAIGSVEDPVGRYISEWKGDQRGNIRIRNLLQMSSGLAHVESGYDVSRDNPGVRQNFGTDFISPILGLPLAFIPGSRFDYNNNNTNLLMVILERATGKRYAQYLSDKLWQPLGLGDARLILDRPGGEPMASCCVLSRPIDWAKVGILIAHKGVWAGRQIVPAQWIKEMTTPSPSSARYGYQIWLGAGPTALEKPTNLKQSDSWQSEKYEASDLSLISGYGMQRVWIIPSLDLVIVRAGKAWPPAWDDAVLPNVIMRAVKK